ncbi:MAG: hypothetical protein IPG87_19755 [Saprospiraceae bacterium]|nr:hypothetical protein [Candidatus Vicinibacter affinis]
MSSKWIGRLVPEEREHECGGHWREGCVDDFHVDKGDRLDSCSSQLGG